MEPKGKSFFSNVADWGMVAGGGVAVIGLMRLITAIFPMTQGYVAADAPASIGGQGNSTIALALIGAGIVIALVFFVIKQQRK
jgi:hypothetical protein